MVKVKICGLTRIEDIDAVNVCEPDYIGFVFANGRHRIDETKANALKSRLSPKIAVVGVFRDADASYIASFARHGIIDVVQLHGDEDREYIGGLKAVVKLPIIKAISMSNDSITHIDAFSDAADYLLFDSIGGGTGVTFDWKCLSNHNIPRPFFLAGGLDAQNVGQAAKILRPFAVDVSSGVETDGVKDPIKISKFVNTSRNLQLN